MFGYITSGKQGDILLKFGVMVLNEFDEYYVCRETTQVPLYPIEYHPEFRFGYTLEYVDNRIFSSSFILSLPRPPKEIQGDLWNAEKSENNKVLKSIPMFYQGEAVKTFAFNQGDPLGRWKIDVYVNNTFIRSIRFTVLPANNI